MAGETTVKVALDWTPNTIHSGLYCALERGLYEGQGLDVQLLPPDSEYAVSPAKRLQKGDCDLAIAPSESCIAYNETGRMKLQAIYAILQRDASAIVSTKHQSITALDRGVYGSYNAKYEDNIVRAMLNAAGGKGEEMRIESSTGKLSLFEEVKKGNLDATWVFMPWEGVEAELDGISMYAFKMGDFGVPYGYSVIARNAGSSLEPEILRKFVAATVSGYEYALQNPSDAAAILSPHCKPSRSSTFLNASQQRINEFYSDGSSGLGQMQPAKWTAWTDWLQKQGLLGKDLAADELFTNEFFA